MSISPRTAAIALGLTAAAGLTYKAAKSVEPLYSAKQTTDIRAANEAMVNNMEGINRSLAIIASRLGDNKRPKGLISKPKKIRQESYYV